MLRLSRIPSSRFLCVAHRTAWTTNEKLPEQGRDENDRKRFFSSLKNVSSGNVSSLFSTSSSRNFSTPGFRFQAAAATEILATTEPLAKEVIDISDPVSISSIAEGLSADLISAAGGTPTLQDLGLGGWSPSGLVQISLDFLHNTGLPWWLTIVAATIVIKSCMMPLVIQSQRNIIKLNNISPQMQEIQQRITEARKMGDKLGTAKASNELMTFMQKKGVNPFKNLMPLLVQTPIFISFFYALRGMTNLPIESMKTGGIGWFTDLTVMDPYYILPAITSITLLVAIETGAEGGMRADNMQTARYVLRAMPFVMFPFIMNFSSAILCYWCTSNAYSLISTNILKVKSIRTHFEIPERIQHDFSKLTLSKRGFWESAKDSYSNIKISKEIEDRARVDEIRFKNAAMGPIVKTYKKPRTATEMSKSKESSS